MLMLTSALIYGDDNEIYIDQSGDTANIDLEQLGSANIIGGLESTAGNLNPLDLDGDNLTLDINQIGGSNTFLGDILADNFTGFFNFDGSSNDFTIQVDPNNTYGADGSNLNVDVTGSSNQFDLDLATSSMASNTDLDWIINGDSNVFDFNINYDGGYFYLDQAGDSRT